MTLVDYWCNAFTPDRRVLWDTVVGEHDLSVKVRSKADDSFTDADTMAKRMDELGIGSLILPCADLPDGADKFAYERYATRPAELSAFRTTHPRHFFGQWSVDPLGGQAALDRAAVALDDPAYVALHLHTHSFDRAFDHADLEPFYALAAARNVPFVMQAGASGGRLPHDCGRPNAIAGPASRHPDLDFVLSHTGAPWTDDAIAMATRHTNVFLGTAAWPPHRWSPELIGFIGGAGLGRCLFGTSFPVVGHRHALARLGETGLHADAQAALLGGAARRIFTRLQSPLGTEIAL